MIKHHKNTAKHAKKQNNGSENLPQFVLKEKGSVTLEFRNKAIFLSTKKTKWNTEILRALSVVEKNHSFDSYKTGKELYSKIFPDSEIVQKLLNEMQIRS